MSSPSDPNSQKAYKREDVLSHNTEESTWVIINDRVFDLTEYMKKHPGGQKGSSIIRGPTILFCIPLIILKNLFTGISTDTSKLGD